MTEAREYAIRDVVIGVAVFSIAVVAIGLVGWALPNIPHTGSRDTVVGVFFNAAGYLILAAMTFAIGIGVVVVLILAGVVGNRIRHR